MFDNNKTRYIRSDLFPYIILITSLNYGILYVFISLDTVDIETNVFYMKQISRYRSAMFLTTDKDICGYTPSLYNLCSVTLI